MTLNLEDDLQEHNGGILEAESDISYIRPPKSSALKLAYFDECCAFGMPDTSPGCIRATIKLNKPNVNSYIFRQTWTGLQSDKAVYRTGLPRSTLRATAEARP
jgi:hypothetical protein